MAKNRANLKSKYRHIPCIYNQFTDEIKGINKFCDFLLSIALWIDINIIKVDGFKLEVEDWTK